MKHCIAVHKQVRVAGRTVSQVTIYCRRQYNAIECLMSWVAPTPCGCSRLDLDQGKMLCPSGSSDWVYKWRTSSANTHCEIRKPNVGVFGISTRWMQICSRCTPGVATELILVVSVNAD